MLSGRGLCDELITHPEESYRLCCVIVCDLETSRIGAPYMYDISSLRVNQLFYVLAKLGILVICWFRITDWLWPFTALYLTVDDVVGSDNSA